MRKFYFLLIFAMAAASVAEMAKAEDLKETLTCTRTLTAPVADQYSPDAGFFLCDGQAKECYLTQNDGTTYRFVLPEHATYSIREINFDMTDARQIIEHRLVTFTEPGSDKKAYVDVFWGENKRAFARNLTQANNHDLATLTGEKTKAKTVAKIANKVIIDEIALIKVMVDRKSGQPGASLDVSKKEWANRLSGCNWNKEAADLKKKI